MYGLSEDTVKSIISILYNFKKIQKAVLFGSRAKGTFKTGSDIDIAIYSKDITHNEFLELQIKMDDLDLIVKVDLILFHKINNPELIDHIERIGIILFDRK